MLGVTEQLEADDAEEAEAAAGAVAGVTAGVAAKVGRRGRKARMGSEDVNCLYPVLITHCSSVSGRGGTGEGRRG